MAEYLGALASAVQLVDVALRASREAYSFLAAVKNAKEDVKELREILRDVEANVRSLRHYANEFQKSKNAVDEFEVLSETITGSFSGFHDDIVALKQILPPKPSPALAEKIKWVYNKRNIGQLTRRLRKRETSLATALSITGRLHGLRIRQDTTILLEQGKATDSIISAQKDVITSNLRTQQHNHDQVLKKLQEANDDVAFARTESHSNNVLLLQHNQHVKDQFLDVQSTAVLHHTATQAAIHEQSNRISDQIREVTRQSTTLMEKIQSSCDALNNIESRTSYPSTSSQLSLEHLTASLGSINTTTMFSTFGVNMMTGILRRELHSALEPILEQALNKSESRKEVMLGHLSNAIQAMTSDAGREMYESDTRSQIPDQVQNQDLCQDGYISDVSGMKGTSYKGDLFPSSHVLDDPQHCYMLTRYRRDWSFKWRIGTLHVCICTTRRRMFGFPEGEIHTEFNVYFLPSQALMQMPGFELRHSTGPDSEGSTKLH